MEELGRKEEQHTSYMPHSAKWTVHTHGQGMDETAKHAFDCDPSPSPPMVQRGQYVEVVKPGRGATQNVAWLRQHSVQAPVH